MPAFLKNFARRFKQQLFGSHTLGAAAKKLSEATAPVRRGIDALKVPGTNAPRQLETDREIRVDQTQPTVVRPPHHPGIPQRPAQRQQQETERQRRQQQELQERAERERRDRRQQAELQAAQSDPLYKFIVQAQWVQCTSSNVRSFRYLMIEEKLHVEYKDGSVYEYSLISVTEAKSLFRAGSKGTWVWDNLRVRGTVLGARKPYMMIRNANVNPVTGRQRHWVETAKQSDEHWSEVAADSGAKKETKTGVFTSHPDIETFVIEPLGKLSRKSPKNNRGRRDGTVTDPEATKANARPIFGSGPAGLPAWTSPGAR